MAFGKQPQKSTFGIDKLMWISFIFLPLLWILFCFSSEVIWSHSVCPVRSFCVKYHSPWTFCLFYHHTISQHDGAVLSAVPHEGRVWLCPYQSLVIDVFCRLLDDCLLTLHVIPLHRMAVGIESTCCLSKASLLNHTKQQSKLRCSDKGKFNCQKKTKVGLCSVNFTETFEAVE